MKIDYYDLGARIRKKREELKISQEELAGLVGLSTQHISNVENARTRIGLEKLVGVANALGCSVDELLCGSLRVGSREVYHEEIASIIEGFTDTQLRVLPEFLRSYNYMYRLMEKNTEREK